MTRYYFDTEFIEDGKTIDPISIGIVAEDGRELYLQNTACDFRLASDWVGRNVFPHLDNFNVVKLAPSSPGPRSAVWRHRATWAKLIELFVGDDEKPEFWAYYADYDWVVLCQLFGTMMDLPKGWPMYCRDIKQLCDDRGNPPLPDQGKGEHHALADARWNKAAHEYILTLDPISTFMGH